MEIASIWRQAKFALDVVWTRIRLEFTDNPLLLLVILAFILALWKILRPEIKSR